MRILFIDPPFNRFTGLSDRYFPTGLSYVAAEAASKGHTVQVFQLDAAAKMGDISYTEDYQRMNRYVKGVNSPEHPVWEEIRRVLRDYRPDLVGISCITPKAAAAFKTADLCKEHRSDLPVVLGGAHPTVSPDQTMTYPSVDYIVRGEGEATFAELVDALDSGAELNTIAGLSYRHNGEVAHNPERSFVRDLDSIRYPARWSLANPPNYSSEDMGVLLTSRGCPYKCTYCYHSWRGRVHFRSVDNVVGEIEEVMERYGTRQFAIKDDTFTVNRAHVLGFCEALLKRGLRLNWDCTTRVDRLDEEMLKLMIRAGCNNVKVGVETGSQRVLDQTKKGTTLEQVRLAASLFHKHGVFWTGYFMMGLPEETEEDIWETYRFMKELNPSYAGLGVFEPFRHTELFDVGVSMGLLYDEVDISHLFQTNPKDYYFKDPRRRVVHIAPERFHELAVLMMKGFHQHNARLSKALRRGWSRRRAYLRDGGLLLADGRKAFAWLARR